MPVLWGFLPSNFSYISSDTVCDCMREAGLVLRLRSVDF